MQHSTAFPKLHWAILFFYVSDGCNCVLVSDSSARAQSTCLFCSCNSAVFRQWRSAAILPMLHCAVASVSDLTSGVCVVHVVGQALPFVTSKHHSVTAALCYSSEHIVVNILVGDETRFLQLTIFIVESLWHVGILRAVHTIDCHMFNAQKWF